MCQGTDSIYRFIDLSESFLKDGRYIDKSLFRHGFIIYSGVHLSDGHFVHRYGHPDHSKLLDELIVRILG